MIRIEDMSVRLGIASAFCAQKKGALAARPWANRRGSAPRASVLGQIRRGGKADRLIRLGHPTNMSAKNASARSTLRRAHHCHEAAEQEVAVPRTGRGFRMVLHREDRAVFERQSAI